MSKYYFDKDSGLMYEKNQEGSFEPSKRFSEDLFESNQIYIDDNTKDVYAKENNKWIKAETERPGLGRSLKAGYHNLMSGFGGLKTGIGSATDNTALQQSGEDLIEKHQRLSNELMVGAQDWRDISSASDVFNFVGENFGASAPHMAFTLGATAIGGPAGAALAGGSRAAAVAGSVAAGTAASATMYTGSNVQRQVLEEDADVDLKKAAAFAIPQALGETLFNFTILGRGLNFTPSETFLGKVGTRVAEAVTLGAPLEAVQQGFERMAAGLEVNPLENEEAADEYMDAFFAGIAGSLPVGTASGVIEGASASKKRKQKESTPVDRLPEEEVVTETSNIPTDRKIGDIEEVDVSPETPSRAEIYQRTQMKDIKIPEQAEQRVQQEVFTETNRQTAKSPQEFITRQLPKVEEGKQRLFTARPVGTDKNFISTVDVEGQQPSQRFGLKDVVYGQDLDEVVARASSSFKEGYEIDAVEVNRQSLDELADGPAPKTKTVPFELHERSQTVYNSDRDSNLDTAPKELKRTDAVPKVTKDGKVRAGKSKAPEDADTPIKPTVPRVRVRAKVDEEGNPVRNPETGIPEYDVKPSPRNIVVAPQAQSRMVNLSDSLNTVHKKALGKDARARRQLGTAFKNIAENPTRVTKDTTGATATLLSGVRTPDAELNNVSDIETWYHLTQNTETIVVPEKDIENSTDLLSKKLAKKNDLNQADVLYSEDQIMAESFADYMANPMGDFGAMKKHFIKARKVIQETQKTLNQNGIRNVNEVFEGDFKQIYNNMVDSQVKRLKSISDEYRKNLEAQQTQNVEGMNELNDGNFMGGFNRWVTSANYLAAKSGLFAAVRDAVVHGRELRENYQHDFSSRLAPIARLPESKRNRLMEIAVHNRRNNRQAILDDDGFLRFINDKGEQTVLRDKNLSQIYIDTQKVFKDIAATRLSKLPHRQLQPIYSRLGLRATPSKLELERVLEKYKSINDNTRDVIQQQIDNLNTLEQLQKKDYAPLMRLGRHQRGITVKDSEGNLKGFYTYEIDKKGRPIHNSDRQEAVKKAQEHKRRLGSKGKMSKEFELTANNLETQLPSEAVTLEILSGLMHLDDSQAFARAHERVMANSKMKGFMKHFKDAEMVEGYSSDWGRALSSYVDSASNYLANAEVADARDTAVVLMEKANVSEWMREYTRKYVESMQSPMEQHQWVRSFQYSWVLGFGLSSATVQLASVPTTMSAILSQANGSHIKSMGILSKNLAQTFKHFTRTTGALEGTPSFMDVLNPERIDGMVKKKLWSENKAQFMKDFNDTGFSLPGFTTELAGLSPNNLKVLSNRVNEKLKKYARLSGIFMSTTETSMRVTMASTLYDMQQNSPQSIQRLHETYMNDGRYRALQSRTNPSDVNQPNLMNLTKVMIEETLGAYGRAERAPYQNSLAGAIVLPFSTYIHRATETTVDLMTRRGLAGKKQAAVLLGSFLSMAGVWGLPGMEVLRFVFENVMTQVTGEESDADEMMREAVVEWAPGELGPMLAQMSSKGILSSLLGADLSKRVGLNVPGEDIVASLNKGGLSMERLGGVPGGIIADTFNAGKRLLNGEDYARVLPDLTPKFIKDPYQANVQWMREGIQSSGGSPAQLEAPEDVSSKSKLLKSFGFNPLEIQERKTYDYKVRASSRKNSPGRTRLRDQLVNALSKEYQGLKNGDLDLVREGRKDKSRLIQELGKFLKETDTPNLGSSLKRTIASARDSALVKVYPERRQLKLTKPQRIKYSDKKLKDMYKVE